MSREQDFASGTVVTPAFLDVIQEMLSGLAVNVRLEKVSSTSVRVAAGTGGGQASLTIAGKYRWITATASLTIAGAAGTYSIYGVVATEAPVETGGDPANRGFVLEQNAGTPTGTNRKIGEVDWDGTAITAVRNLVGPAPTHNPVFTGAGFIDTPASNSAANEMVTAKWVRDYIASLNIADVGDIKISPTSTLQAGWLWCDGSALLRTGTYAALFAKIGTTWGAGDGSTTFNLPDFRGRVAVGLDNMDNTVGTGGGDAARLDVANTLGGVGGAQYVALTASQTGIRAHTHTATTGTESTSHTHSGYTEGIYGGAFNVAAYDHTHGYSGSTGGPNATASQPSGTSGSIGLATSGHAHGYSGTTGGVSAYQNVEHSHHYVTGGQSVFHTHFMSTDALAEASGSNHNNMQPYALVNYVIKY